MQKKNKELEIDNEVYWIREVGHFEIVANLDFFFLLKQRIFKVLLKYTFEAKKLFYELMCQIKSKLYV